MRVRKKPWAKKELEINNHIVHEPEKWKGKWNEYFGNHYPLYVEIGCGKGGFLSKNAELYPRINFIGIERQSTIVAIAARKMEEDFSNVALIWSSAEKLSDLFETGELKRLYINFCDPWPKERWSKRRLTYRDFLETYKKVFGKNGEIFFKTDNKELFEFSKIEFQENGWDLSYITTDLHHSDYEGNIMTEYEKRFSEMGMPIYHIQAKFQK